MCTSMNVIDFRYVPSPIHPSTWVLRFPLDDVYVMAQWLRMSRIMRRARNTNRDTDTPPLESTEANDDGGDGPAPPSY